MKGIIKILTIVEHRKREPDKFFALNRMTSNVISVNFS
ncbi:hypothetical protein U27_05395 [Candidatus Vecturithrix granuli]|uniref:Uncharacterized protein n=1 Tax=Vecturithrix granuli TaxID=1499967 RepID=A0A081C1G6_VECG1|nr:hypothetical protein U27_05395 [Candidatus Vecturithrix granuli]